MAKTLSNNNSSALPAQEFIDVLYSMQSDIELQKIKKYFKSEKGDYGHGDIFIGIKMGDIFKLASANKNMPIIDIKKMLQHKIHEVRVAAVSIMDKASRDKNISAERLHSFFNLYIKQHKHINNWDLVDLGCLNMTGRHLFDKEKNILFDLASSKNLWERRTAILSTCYFIRHGQLDDTYKIASLLLFDDEDLIHKAVGWMLRFAGDKNKDRLIKFLDEYAAKMPRVMLRNCIEKFEPTLRQYYLKL